MKRRFTLVLLLVLVSGLMIAMAQVSNVRLRQLDSLLRVTYDLKGLKSPEQVRLYFVTATGDTLRPANLRGHVGTGVKPGNNRRITWNLATERVTLNTDLEAVVLAEYPPRIRQSGKGGPVYACFRRRHPVSVIFLLTQGGR